MVEMTPSQLNALEAIRSDWQTLEDYYEERAAILEYDAHMSRYEAEQFAAQLYGFANKAELKAYIQELKANDKFRS